SHLRPPRRGSCCREKRLANERRGVQTIGFLCSQPRGVPGEKVVSNTPPPGSFHPVKKQHMRPGPLRERAIDEVLSPLQGPTSARNGLDAEKRATSHREKPPGSGGTRPVRAGGGLACR